ncbi:Hypothetical predicted protein [Olea europaea subsp. europaea]|uniref:Uncharacterized protein n=1 Tax=Olea europaea subsp. europaea TaxID=158383 RepID=A0A8S0RI48_OLEEU|nr:Hypothetical predicted protein [Olea europaea subsp. europaea]
MNVYNPNPKRDTENPQINYRSSIPKIDCNHSENDARNPKSIVICCLLDLATRNKDSFLSEETVQKIMSETFHESCNLRRAKQVDHAMGSMVAEAFCQIYITHSGWSQPCPTTVQQEQVESSENDMESNQLYDVPPCPENPLSLDSKHNTSVPSPLLAFHLIGVIYSYRFTLQMP